MNVGFSIHVIFDFDSGCGVKAVRVTSDRPESRCWGDSSLLLLTIGSQYRLNAVGAFSGGAIWMVVGVKVEWRVLIEREV